MMSNIRAVVAGATSGSTTMLTDVFKLVESFMEGMVVPLAGPDMDENAKAIMTSGFMTRFAALMSGPGGGTDKKVLTFIQNEMRTTFVPNMPGLGLFMKTLLTSDVFEKLSDLISMKSTSSATTLDKIMDFIFDTVVKGIFAKSLPAAKAGEVDFPMIFASPVIKGIVNKIVKGVTTTVAVSTSATSMNDLAQKASACAMKSGAMGGDEASCAGLHTSGCKWAAGMTLSGITLPGTCSFDLTPAPPATSGGTAEKRNPTVVFMEDMFKYLEGEPRKLLLAAFPDLSFLSGGMMSDADMRTLIQSTIYDDVVAFLDLVTTTGSSTTAIFESVEKFM
jgi:hypothetical protein